MQLHKLDATKKAQSFGSKLSFLVLTRSQPCRGGTHKVGDPSRAGEGLGTEVARQDLGKGPEVRLAVEVPIGEDSLQEARPEACPRRNRTRTRKDVSRGTNVKVVGLSATGHGARTRASTITSSGASFGVQSSWAQGCFRGCAPKPARSE